MRTSPLTNFPYKCLHECGHSTLRACAIPFALRLLLFIVIASMLFAKHNGSPTAAVQIAVTNGARVPVKELNRSLAIAGELMRPTGIQVTWLLPSNTATPPRGIPRIHLAIQLKSDVPDKTWILPVLGYTRLERDPPVAIVLADHVLWLADRYGLPAPVVMACTVVHEIGHVLLRSHTHDVSGIMRAQLRLQDFRAAEQFHLGFFSEEAARMRQTLWEETARLRSKQSSEE